VLDLALLVFVGDIFSGLTALQVAAVGHVTAIVVSVPLGILLARHARRRLPPETAESGEFPDSAESAVPDVRDRRR
jgi:membrane associated rhomboid family serine protease